MCNKISEYYTFHKLCLLYIIFENLSDFEDEANTIHVLSQILRRPDIQRLYTRFKMRVLLLTLTSIQQDKCHGMYF
jgi:hypothetical protein